MEPVHVRFTKWDGRLHWHFDVVRLGDDEHGVWLGGSAGTPVRRGEEPPIISTEFALLIPNGSWWTATFNPTQPDGPFGYSVYVDICTPPEWEGNMVTAVDLDLDVGRRLEGGVELLDEDEFDDHRVAMGYPPRIVDQARAAAASVFTKIERGDEPFVRVGTAWLERAAVLP